MSVEEENREAILEAAKNPEKELDRKYYNPTFGEKLVGITFNPSGDDKVLRAKVLCAELADLLAENTPADASPLHNMLINKAIVDILDAQMNVVKCLTFKY